MLNNLFFPPVSFELEIALDGDEESKSVEIAQITGPVKIKKLWGELVSGVITNLTGAFFDIDDGTINRDLTLDGAVLSAKAPGTLFIKNKAADTALSILAPGEGGEDDFIPYFFNPDPETVSKLRFNYTTTEDPIEGVVRIHVEYEPIGIGELIPVEAE